MPTPFSDFVRHYVHLSNNHMFRALYDKAWNGIQLTNEVQAVNSFLLKDNVGVHFLNSEVAPLMTTERFSVKFASIFCHKKPIVTRTNLSQRMHHSEERGCELGDLCILFVLIDENRVIKHCAGSIFQAKIESKLKNEAQRFLYDLDPDFEVPKHLEKYRSSKHRQMPTYDEGRAKGFRYLILKDEDKRLPQARYTPWGPQYFPYWSTFVDGLLAGTDGLRANVCSTAPSAWDIIVEDLLYVIHNIPDSKPSRGNKVAKDMANSIFYTPSPLKFTMPFQRYSLGTLPLLNDVTTVTTDTIPTLMIIAHDLKHQVYGRASRAF